MKKIDPKMLQQLQNAYVEQLNVLGEWSTGIHALDDIIQTIEPSRFIVVGGCTGVGKTDFLISLSAAVSQRKVTYLTLSEEKNSIINKIIAHYSQVDRECLSKGKVSGVEFQNYAYAVQVFENECFIEIDDEPNTSIDQLEHQIRLNAQEGCKIFIIDSLQQVKPVKETTYESMSELSRRLKSLSLEVGVTIIASTSVGHKIIDRVGYRPHPDDLRNFGTLIDNCDQLLLLHRYDLRDPHDKPRLMQISVAKNRLGPLGICNCVYIKESGLVADMANQS